MEISGIDVMRQSVPLVKPFKTALRTVSRAESVLVRMTLNDGRTGWGEAPPTVVITGESMESIEAAVAYTFAPLLIGRSVLAYEQLLQSVHQSMAGASSAKAAVDMAVYDLVSQCAQMPLYQFLGGYRDKLETDFTVSVNTPEEMGDDAAAYARNGFTVLKIKVGKDSIERDIERIREVRRRVGKDIKIRVDANQGWQPKEAVRSIRRMEDMGLDIELVEQPVKAHDIDGLKTVTDAVETPVMADESVFSPLQAFDIIRRRAADMLNIKLMKSGGIYYAQLINQMAEQFGMECMVGSMIESRVAVTAAAHFAASKKNITRVDLDAPLMLLYDTVDGGVEYDGPNMLLPRAAGLGIRNVVPRETEAAL
ncbi:dipeptide epimerase [Paenibacillus mesophilus]|uniref:dipeptide epimerase n=1 Tax=Paenibacillus mesophilus TaxID=2582849 RepID=UPI00110E3870|nr:dipeptide epimerase [Paenibacillus mesophilus]TMV47016.1 dipeptide epimerase [Paenibacillus mesophilus]